MAFAARYHLGLVFLCFALVVTLCIADERNKRNDERTIRDDDVSARMQSRSGRIMVVRDDDGDNSGDDSGDGDDNDNDSDNDNDDDDDDDFSDDNQDMLSFVLDGIEEKDADGNDVGLLEKHSVDFDSKDFTFSQVNKDSSFQGVRAINVNLSTYLDDPKSHLDIMVYLFREDGTVTFGSETFAVQAGTVKFNVKISNWDFCDGTTLDCSEGKAGAYLDLSMKIRSRDSPSEIDDDDRKQADKPPVCQDKPDDGDDGNDDDDDCPRIYDMGGDSEMLLNRGVMYDNTKYTAMPPGFPKFEIDDGQKKVTFRLSKFDDNALVDPSVTPGRVQKSASSAHACWLQIHVVFILLLQIVIMYAAH